MTILSGTSWRVGYRGDKPVQGRVALVRSQADLHKVKDGDIMVAPQTDVNYTAAMLRARAVVTEEGGRYSHAATFTRENGINCIIGASGIMGQLHDGDLVIVDTQAKTITIVSTATE